MGIIQTMSTGCRLQSNRVWIEQPWAHFCDFHLLGSVQKRVQNHTYTLLRSTKTVLMWERMPWKLKSMWGRTREKTEGRMQDPGWSWGRKLDLLISPTQPPNLLFHLGNWISESMGRFSTGIYLRQDSINGVPALRQHQVFVKHEVEGEGLAERVRADASLLCAVLLEAVQVLVERLFLRVLLLDQKLDVVTLLALWLNHLQQSKVSRSSFWYHRTH